MFEGTFKTSLSFNKVIGGLSGGYFNFFCEKCGARVRVKYAGHENNTPKFDSVCKCGETYSFKALILDVPQVAPQQK